jgi:hypothetical protein
VINHAYTVLYNLTAAPPSGVLVDLEQSLSIPDILLSVERIAGTSLEERDEFAIRCLKILDGSSYRLEVVKYDQRLTYDLHRLDLEDLNLQPFMAQWMGLGPTIINYLLSVRRDALDTYLHTQLTQEAVAALIVSYLDAVTAHNE